MRVSVHELKPGYVVSKNVFVKSANPLIESGTVLDARHIAFLKAFLIRLIDVKDVDSDVENAPEQQESGQMYRHAVETYGHFFSEWQTGGGIDIGRFRQVMVPALNHILDDPVWLAHFLLSGAADRSQMDHNVALGVLSAFLARKLNFVRGDIHQVGLSGMLADCGMAKFPPSQLNKGENDDGAQRAWHAKHVLYSYKMVRGISTLTEDAMLAVVQHHEREDGSGFPLHLKGDKINLYGKILAVCDSFLDYQAEMPAENPVSVLEALAHQSYRRLSGFLTEKFISGIMMLFIGMSVVLTNNQKGKIVFIPDKDPLRPFIQSADGSRIFSLEKNPTLRVIRIVS
ncbi:MAG: HD domain-containing protein [Sporolactobacillus sp.]|jgi:HD-GYP domain-containing protein (c-di-GMP phosphodiesterase class II)|nr:HD domain-containing protein [Sporolactobacillus sp.]